MSFALRWQAELENIWHLIDANGKIYLAQYNHDLENPTIVVDWTKLRDYYRLTGNHQVSMIHFFPFDHLQKYSQPLAYPKWYSLYHQNPNSMTFRILLDKYKATCTSLVSNS